MQPWERLENETPKAYAAFCKYYRLVPEERSISKVREKIGKRSASERGLETWSSRYNWVSRAQAWDDYIEAQNRKRNERERLRMYERQAKMSMEMQNRGLKVVKAHYVEGTFVSDGIKMITEGVKIERTSRGEPGDVVKTENQVKITWDDIITEFLRDDEK